MSKRDCYEVLGVARDANAQNIKSAYRKLALKYHPDRNPGDSAAEERFKEAAEAYAILADNEKRAIYDRVGHAGLGATPSGGIDPTIFEDFGDILGNLGDVFGFGDLFGGRRRAGPRLCADRRLARCSQRTVPEGSDPHHGLGGSAPAGITGGFAGDHRRPL